jgi:hypothetical protein
MKTSLKLCSSLLILIVTLACAFVQNMVFSPSQTPEPIDTPQPIPCTNDDCLDACLDRLDKVLETSPFAPIGNSIYEEQGANFNLVIYKVKGDEIVEPTVLYVPDEYRKYQEDTASHLRIWDFYVAIIPPKLRKSVKEFVIFTDGPNGDVGAWVQPSTTDQDSWQVGFDLLDSDYPLFVADALVHETAHLLTLNSSQIPEDKEHYYFYNSKDKSVLGCSQYVVDGKCSLPSSYINLFYQRFWKDIYPEWWEKDQQAQNTKSFEEYLQMMEQFYDQHSEFFLNSYAASNVSEDIAESFAFFVLNARPSGNSVSNHKVTFFYEFPELVEYRQQMIKGLCSYLR